MSDEHVTAHPPAASSHAITAHGSGAATAGEVAFSDAEIEMLHRQDVAAGRAVVILMCSIFLIGVFIYSFVAIAIAF